MSGLAGNQGRCRFDARLLVRSDPVYGELGASFFSSLLNVVKGAGEVR